MTSRSSTAAPILAVLATALVTLGSCGCRWARTSVKPKQDPNLTGTPEEVEARLTELIPVGTGAATAKEQLEKLGFKVSPRSEPESLFADKQLTESPWVSRRWMVVVSTPDGVVGSIDITSGLIGP